MLLCIVRFIHNTPLFSVKHLNLVAEVVFNKFSWENIIDVLEEVFCGSNENAKESFFNAITETVKEFNIDPLVLIKSTSPQAGPPL